MPSSNKKIDNQAEAEQVNQSNNIAVVGFVLSFLVAPVGLALSIMGLKKSKNINDIGMGWSIAGIVISAHIIVVGLLMTLLILPFILWGSPSPYSYRNLSDIMDTYKAEVQILSPDYYIPLKKFQGLVNAQVGFSTKQVIPLEASHLVNRHDLTYGHVRSLEFYDNFQRHIQWSADVEGYSTWTFLPWYRCRGDMWIITPYTDYPMKKFIRNSQSNSDSWQTPPNSNLAVLFTLEDSKEVGEIIVFCSDRF